MRSLLVVVAIMVSGCFGVLGDDDQLSNSEARVVAQDAVEQFAADFSSVDGGQLRLVRGEFGASDSELGFNEASFEAEWGTGGTARVEMVVGTGASSFTIGLHCDAQRTIISYGGTRLEARPAPDRTCLEALQEDSDPVSMGEFGDMQVSNVTVHEDGSITATFASDEGNMTGQVDAKGRLSRIDLADGGGFMRMDYGERRSISMPEATSRMPALVFGFGFFDGTQYSWTASSAQEAVPFSEVEVRIQDPQNHTVAAFIPGPGQQTKAGFTFDYVDDGDGLFGIDDAFTLRHDAWTQEGQYDVLVWDVWAGREVGDVPIPAPALLLLAFALVAIAWTRR